MIELGSRARDRYTGMEGTVVRRTESLHGSPEVVIQPDLDDNGSVPDSVWFNEGRVVSIDRDTPNNKAGFTATPEK